MDVSHFTHTKTCTHEKRAVQRKFAFTPGVTGFVAGQSNDEEPSVYQWGRKEFKWL